MCCCKLKTWSTCGWAFTLIYSLLGVAGIILIAFPFNFLRFEWASDANYKSLGVITLTGVCVLLVAMIFGFVQFCNCAGNCCYGVIFLIIQLACALFTFAISLFGLVAGTMGSMKDYTNCDNNKYKGILGFWKNMDKLFEYVSDDFCTNECVCYISDEVRDYFIGNDTTKDDESKWISREGGAATFKGCSDTIKLDVAKKFEEWDLGKGNYIGKLDIDKFADYWERVENTFECSGFCKPYYRYLFSNINNGVVQKEGCLDSFINWVSPLLLSYGGIAFFSSLIAIWTWLIGIFLMCHCYKKEETNIKI